MSFSRPDPRSNPRTDLLRILAQKSFRLGEFKLSSGGTSDYYIDCRSTTLDAKGSRLTGEVFTEEIRQRGWKPAAIGGLTMGADPIVTAVSVSSTMSAPPEPQPCKRSKLPANSDSKLSE